MAYESPNYETEQEMLQAFKDLTDLTGQEPICNFYKNNQYIPNGTELYERFLLDHTYLD